MRGTTRIIMKSIQLTKLGLGGLAGLALALAGSIGADTANAENWPTWRGPAANGVAPGGNPPTEFSESKNVQWKIKVPGSGTSTPVIWGDQVFVLTAEKTGKKVAAAASGESRERGQGVERGRRPYNHEIDSTYQTRAGRLGRPGISTGRFHRGKRRKLADLARPGGEWRGSRR